jgi:3-oxoacyl-[acyl-carrier protein] reductase
MTTMGELHERVAIVTGGSRGIGRCLVLELVRAGAKVVFCTRTERDASEVVATGVALGGQVTHLTADVALPGDVDRLFAETLSLHGRVDLVVHNAGISHGALLVSLDEEALDGNLATNSGGAFLVARQTAREVTRQGNAISLVMIGSLAQHGSPSNASYAASKGALLGLTRAVAAEYGALGLRAHLAVVGFVETELTRDLPQRTRSLLIDTCPQKRAATAEEVAVAVVGVLATDGALRNGEPFFISGGLSDIPA